MRTFFLLCIILLGISSVSHAQYPAHTDSGISEGVTYLDLGIGIYGFEMAASGQPAEDWGGTLFLNWYPGPFGSLYSIDSRYIAGAVLK